MLVKDCRKCGLDCTQRNEQFNKFDLNEFDAGNEDRTCSPKAREDKELQALLEKIRAQTLEQLLNELKADHSTVRRRFKSMGNLVQSGRCVHLEHAERKKENRKPTRRILLNRFKRRHFRIESLPLIEIGCTMWTTGENDHMWTWEKEKLDCKSNSVRKEDNDSWSWIIMCLSPLTAQNAGNCWWRMMTTKINWDKPWCLSKMFLISTKTAHIDASWRKRLGAPKKAIYKLVLLLSMEALACAGYTADLTQADY